MVVFGLGKQDFMRREKWRELQLSLSPISLSLSLSETEERKREYV